MSDDAITRKIITNPKSYIIFYSEWCGYSTNAIQLLKDKNVQFKGYKIDKINGKMKTVLCNLSKTKELTGYNPNHKSRPIIFKYSKFLGGYTELYTDLQS